VFTLLPILTGEGRAHHGEILREATKLCEAGQIVPKLDPRHFTLATIDQAYDAIRTRTATGKIVVDIGTKL
jgi:NADPH2:quinone reductase